MQHKQGMMLLLLSGRNMQQLPCRSRGSRDEEKFDIDEQKLMV
jgi:hypothetical protein